MGCYDTDGGDSASPSDASSRYSQKCDICKKRFKSESAWSRHTTKRDSNCRLHEVCFPWDDNLEHARDEEHTRCFVNGCESKFAQGEWYDDDILEHIEEEHTDWGSGSGTSSGSGFNERMRDLGLKVPPSLCRSSEMDMVE